MEAILRELCKQHGLTNISILYQGEDWNRINVYLHWNEDGEGVCTSNDGDTFDEALAAALADMNCRRDIAAPSAPESIRKLVKGRGCING